MVYCNTMKGRILGILMIRDYMTVDDYDVASLSIQLMGITLFVPVRITSFSNSSSLIYWNLGFDMFLRLETTEFQ